MIIYNYKEIHTYITDHNGMYVDSVEGRESWRRMMATPRWLVRSLPLSSWRQKWTIRMWCNAEHAEYADWSVLQSLIIFDNLSDALGICTILHLCCFVLSAYLLTPVLQFDRVQQHSMLYRASVSWRPWSWTGSGGCLVRWRHLQKASLVWDLLQWSNQISNQTSILCYKLL
jgi:hypothetical protein